jgi:hypothetical protein
MKVDRAFFSERARRLRGDNLVDPA